MPHAFNPKPNNPALGQLVRLHADIGGQIAENKKLAAKLADDMRHVEAVIRMFDPAYDLRRIAMRRRRRSRSPWFKRGTIFREAISALREAGKPLTTREIVGRLLASKHVREPTEQQVRDLVAGARASLEYQTGKVVERTGEGTPTRWRLIETPA